MPRHPKEKEKKSKYYHELKPTRVDLTRDDCYELCYDVVEDTRVFTGKINERLLVERYSSLAENNREFDDCQVIDVLEQGVLIKLWDEVREQTYFIDLRDADIPLVLRVLKNIKVKRVKHQTQETSNAEEQSKEIE